MAIFEIFSYLGKEFIGTFSFDRIFFYVIVLLDYKSFRITSFRMYITFYIFKYAFHTSIIYGITLLFYMKGFFFA